MKLRHLPIALLALTLLPLAACSSGDDGGDDKALTVYAGSGLGSVLEELVTQFNEENTEYEATVVAANNDGLVDAIREGEAADLIVATPSGLKPLIDEGKVMANPPAFGTDPIEIVVALDNPKQVAGLSVFGDDAAISGLCREESGCGRAGRRLLTEAGITAAPDVVAEEGGALLEQVVNGEVDAALLFRTQRMNRVGRTSVVALPPGSPVVETKYESGKVNSEAKTLAFLDWLQNAPTAQRILRNRGLAPTEAEAAAAAG